MKVKQYEMVIADTPHEMQRRVEEHLAAGWDLFGQMYQRPDGQLVREMVFVGACRAGVAGSSLGEGRCRGQVIAAWFCADTRSLSAGLVAAIDYLTSYPHHLQSPGASSLVHGHPGAKFLADAGARVWNSVLPHSLRSAPVNPGYREAVFQVRAPVPFVNRAARARAKSN